MISSLWSQLRSPGGDGICSRTVGRVENSVPSKNMWLTAGSDICLVFYSSLGVLELALMQFTHAFCIAYILHIYSLLP